MSRNIKNAWAKLRAINPWVLIAFSLSLSVHSHFDRVHREQGRAQRQITLDAINRDCAQLQRESDEHYRKGKVLIANKHWTKEDMAFAEGFSKQSKSFKARYAAIQRRCREFNAVGKNQ